MSIVAVQAPAVRRREPHQFRLGKRAPNPSIAKATQAAPSTIRRLCSANERVAWVMIGSESADALIGYMMVVEGDCVTTLKPVA